MSCNIGTVDRIIRGILGIAIIGAGIYYNSWWGLLGIVPLGTAYLGHCAAYRPFGWTTVGKKNKCRNINEN